MRRREFITFVGSAVAAWPLGALAQPTAKVPLVGYLWHAANAEEEGPYYKALLEGFPRYGYAPGRNVILEHRFPNENPERFRSMAAELVSLNPDVLMGGAIGSTYLKQATSKIPIVFMFVPDPVGLKLVESIARPGGNATGLVTFGRDLVGKRLQFLKEIVPGLSRVALLINSDQPTSRVFIDETQAAASELGISIQVFDARTLDALNSTFDSMMQSQMHGIITASGGTIFQWRAIIAKLALEHRLPYCAFSRETFEVGALMSYGADQIEMCRYSVSYVDKILKGAKPSDLPVQQPTKLETLINLKVAKALGLTIPAKLLYTADEVIE
jgi:putative tryptophan/tyrosine transport system substrate-binding protein